MPIKNKLLINKNRQIAIAKTRINKALIGRQTINWLIVFGN